MSYGASFISTSEKIDRVQSRVHWVERKFTMSEHDRRCAHTQTSTIALLWRYHYWRQGPLVAASGMKIQYLAHSYMQRGISMTETENHEVLVYDSVNHDIQMVD